MHALLHSQHEAREIFSVVAPLASVDVYIVCNCPDNILWRGQAVIRCCHCIMTIGEIDKCGGKRNFTHKLLTHTGLTKEGKEESNGINKSDRILSLANFFATVRITAPSH